ncbi:hypothetical protein [Peteryoungia desertarenae]|uniref:hypothetical protein n=1 Tax=Peteryoungia desertarenae TaxID=1813451 RepID=UPI001FE75DDD|nr:hypothetical protein [Peteryoungia desertarenae]
MQALTRQQIAQHPLFPAIEKQIAEHLIEIHTQTPRLSRLKASHRKWLMSQSMFALALRRKDDDPLSGLTATRFIEMVITLDCASRNTATAFLAELTAYKFLRDVPDVPDKRVRVLEPTEISYAAMFNWFRGHMICLDRLDGGSREATIISRPHIFRVAQPIGADILMADPVWKNPVDSIGHFLSSDLGGMVLHDIFSRLDPNFDRTSERVYVGSASLSEISEIYQISQTNLKRMFKKAETEELLGWDHARRRGPLWLSKTFIDDYFNWQSAKFAGLDRAFHMALDEIGSDAMTVDHDDEVLPVWSGKLDAVQTFRVSQ